MTDKIQQARRAAFESQMEALNKSPGEWRGNHYSNPYGNSSWLGFNAALDCVLIDSPGEFEGADSDGSHAWNACHRSFVDAIESTNLGIKVK